MRCYLVTVHGKLDWAVDASAADDFGKERPAGFYCHRYVLASNEKDAASTAFKRVLKNFDDQFGWLKEGFATLDLEVDSIAPCELYKLLKTDNRGHTFYLQE